MGTVLFWVVTQRVLVIPYRRFGKRYWSPLQGSRIQETKSLENGANSLSRNVCEDAATRCVTAQGSAVLFYTGTALSQELFSLSVRSKVQIPPPSRIENFNLAGKLNWQTWRAVTDIRLMHVFGCKCRDSRKTFPKKLLPAKSQSLCPSRQRARRPPLNSAVTGPRSLLGKTRP